MSKTTKSPSHIIRGARSRLIQLFPSLADKYGEETDFWRQEIEHYQDWYGGQRLELYGHKPPLSRQKAAAQNPKDAAILTWLEIHQKPKYLHDLDLDKTAFNGMRVLDIGAGPIPSAVVFEKAEIYALDPLLDRYITVGYPLHYYDRVKFIHGYSENIPIQDSFFDAVISVNAIDHVDDFAKTSAEIKRVLKKDGKLALHVHYHKATATEPIELTDAIMKKVFRWCFGLQKISQSTTKYGSGSKSGEQYVLWRNF